MFEAPIVVYLLWLHMDNINSVQSLDVAVIKQKLSHFAIRDISGAVSNTLKNLSLGKRIKPGQTVAVAVGSRGIHQLDTVVFHSLQFLMEQGLKPYIIPAMGSHGGATPQGQRDVLVKLGITESAMKVKINAGMDVTCVDQLSNGTKIYFSRNALQADHLAIINRVKPHTKFRADIESGLCKMLTIGLGKQRGAAEFHRSAVKHSFGIIEEAAGVVLDKCNVLFGLALLEDGYGNLSRVEAILPKSMIEREKKLLTEARSLMGRIPFDFIDILVIDFFGKNISGIGMDSNITGRHRDIVGDFYYAPHVKRIFVRDLTPQSAGNATGIGLADITTRRLVEALDMQKTYANALTAISPEKAAIPVYFDTDRQALNACAHTAGLESLSEARMVRIKDTASMEIFQVSAALGPEVASNSDLVQLTPWGPLEFDSSGNLKALSHHL
jgi:hypothetical protein